MSDLGKCLSYIDCQAIEHPRPVGVAIQRPKTPSITISRQTGSGGRIIAEKLAACLQSREVEPGCPWTVFDKNLVEKVLEDHHLPKRLAQFMTEERKSMIDDIMEELLGLHPPSWTLVHQTAETILQLADMGHVILVGRGAHVIAARLENVFHVRLVAGLETRVARIMELQHLDAREAREVIAREEEGRRRYLQKNFDADVEDPLQYHLTINTDRFSYDEAARLIANAVRTKFPANAN